MANHEINVECQNCLFEFDIRIHYKNCPMCQTQYVFTTKKPENMRKLFHFTDAQLKANNYDIEGYYNKNSPSDTYNTRYVKTCKKIIDEDLRIEIVFGYDVDKDLRHTLTDSSIYFVVNDVAKPLTIETLWQLEWFFMSIKEHLREAS